MLRGAGETRGPALNGRIKFSLMPNHSDSRQSPEVVKFQAPLRGASLDCRALQFYSEIAERTEKSSDIVPLISDSSLNYLTEYPRASMQAENPRLKVSICLLYAALA
jgi:hypothetical protein